jgi:hypothetical protein
MTLGLIFGVSLVMTGLVLLCHLSYTHLDKMKPVDETDVEDPSMGNPKERHNDCLLPFCFFQVSQVMNHESWIVTFLLCGATVLVLSMV